MSHFFIKASLEPPPGFSGLNYLIGSTFGDIEMPFVAVEGPYELKTRLAAAPPSN
jgi:hypothetical protein